MIKTITLSFLVILYSLIPKGTEWRMMASFVTIIVIILFSLLFVHIFALHPNEEF